MSLGLSAPAAVPVEVRAGERRIFRLSLEIGTGGVRLEKPAPFEPGEPVQVRFTVPGQSAPLELEARVVATGEADEQDGQRGGSALHFLQPPVEAATEIAAYISDRLGIPLPPGL